MTFPFRFSNAGHGGDDGKFSSSRQTSTPSETSIEAPSAADSHLLERLRNGDQHALREIVDTHGPALLSLATAITGSAELGDDVVQQVFIRLWDRRDTLQVQGALRQYLWRATRNQSITLRRQEQRVHEVARNVRQVVVATNDGAAALDAAALIAQISGVLEELPPRCREIFLLNWRDALTPAEIADVFGISIATVRNQILRAVKHLGRHFGHQ